MNNITNNSNSQGSQGNNGPERHGGSNAHTFQTFTFGSSHDDSQVYRQNQARPNNSATDFSDQVFRVKTGEPTSRATRANQYAIGSELARPNSAPMPQSFDDPFLGSDFEAFKAKIQAGSFQRVRDEFAAGTYAMDEGSGESYSQEPYLKTSSEGRKKRSNSDPMIAESFFDAFTFGDAEHNGKETRGRQRDGRDRSKPGPYKRSRSVDGVDQMANMAASLFPGLDGADGYCSDNSDVSEFDFKQDIDPVRVSFTNKPKRRSSEPLINADLFNDTSNFDFQMLGHKAQDMSAFTMNDGDGFPQPNHAEKKTSSRQRSNSEPMFSEEFANAFGEWSGGGGSGDNIDLIQDVLGLDGSGRSFDSDEEEKPSASSSMKRNNSAPLLSADFFDTVFDEQIGGANKNQNQNYVGQNELDMFVQKMFKTEGGNQVHGQMSFGGMGDHQRSRSLDAISSFHVRGNNLVGGNMQNLQFTQTLHKENPTREESLALYDVLFSGGSNNMTPGQNVGAPSFNLMSMPQTMGDHTGQFETNRTRQCSWNKNEETTYFVLNAIKATEKQLQTLDALLSTSGDAAAMEEVANAFKITASASQYVLTSDLSKAVSILSKAQSTIEMLWHKISGNIGLKNNQMPEGTYHVVTGTDILSDGRQLVNMAPKHRDSDSICSEITSVSIPSRSASPAAIQPSSAMSIQSTRSNKSTGSKRSKSSRSTCPDLKDLPPRDDSNPDVIMVRLKALMERTQHSQKKLQRWDKKNGLPKSHSQTMVNSNRSRKQLQDGVVLKKWNGVPLIGENK